MKWQYQQNRYQGVFTFLGFWNRLGSPLVTSSTSTLHLYTQFGNTVVCCGQTAYLSISVTRSSKSRKGHYISYSPIPTILTLSWHIDLWFRVWHSICDHPESCLHYLLPPLCAESQPYNLRSSKGTRPNIGIRSHRWRSIGYRFFPILLNVGPDIIRTKWNGIGNKSQFFIRPINIGHQKYLAAQITRHKNKSKRVNDCFSIHKHVKFPI